MGYSLSAVFVIFMLSAFMSITYIYTSTDYAVNSITNAYNSKVFRDYNKLYSNLEVVYINASQQGATTYDLEIKIFDNGDADMTTKKMSFVVNGTLMTPDYFDKPYLLPQNNLTVDFYNVSGTGTGVVRIITQFGSSTYSTYKVT